MSSEINLDTHIRDIVDLFHREEIRDAVLCAHSYGGWPVSGALEHLGGRVSAVVFLDAHVPNDGDLGMNSSHHRPQIELALREGRPSHAPPRAATFALRPENCAYVDSMMTPQPVGVSQQAIRLTGARDLVKQKIYIRAAGFPSLKFDRYRDAAQANGWEVREIACGHEIMIDEPEQLTAMLLGICQDDAAAAVEVTQGGVHGTHHVILVNERDEEIGTMARSEAHQKGLFHRIAVIYVENAKGQILVQVRKKNSLLDHSSAGHVDPGESYADAARRELAEELGIMGVKLIRLGHGRSLSTRSPDGNISAHVFDVFWCSAAPGDLQTTEVADVFWRDPYAVLTDMEQDRQAARHTEGFKASLPIYLEARERQSPC
jgi:isopentenyldiphosphate isomerase